MVKRWRGLVVSAAVFLGVAIIIYQGFGPHPAKDEGKGRVAQGGETMPWAQATDFLRAQQRAGTPLLLTSYRAKLPDPILFERHNIALAAQILRGAVVEPGQTFSLNEHLGERTLEKGFKAGPMYSEGQIVEVIGGGVCKISSLLYNVVVLANLEIVERSAHSMLVPYVPPGQDATLCYGTKDFKFRNTSPDSILIWAENIDDTLYMALYSNHKGPKVTWFHETLEEIPIWTEYKFDPLLAPGEKRLEFAGFRGLTIHSQVVVRGEDGREEVKDLGISTYQPAPRIVTVPPPPPHGG